MIRKPVYRVLVSMCSLAVTLGVAWGCDALIRFLSYLNSQLFTLNYVILWVYALVGLLPAGLWLLLAWFVLIREPRNTWVSLIYLLVGLGIVVYPALYYTPALCCFLGYFPMLQMGPTMYFYSTGGVVGIVGLAGYLLRRGKEK
jgi:hypothetical protein